METNHLAVTLERVQDILEPQAGQATVARATLGLFFVAVTLDTGHTGLCATPLKEIPEAVCCPSSAMSMPFPGKLAGMGALRLAGDLHAQACEQAAFRPLDDTSGWPFRNKLHTRDAILCGDWNLEPGSDEYLALQQPFEATDTVSTPGGDRADALFDAWTLAHPGQPHAPTFQLFDRCYRPAPITVDYVLVSDGLRTRVRRVDVDLQTQSSDHQSVLIELG